jgi:F-type H+-transporting ATPase subunit b
MHVDWWTLGLQAINVLILIWLLGRYFWTPVSQIIAQRQQAQQDLLAQAQAARDAALAEKAALARSDEEWARLRDEALARATADAEKLRQHSSSQAQHDAQVLLDGARTQAAALLDAARRQIGREAVDLGLRIARRLVGRLAGPCVQRAFCVGLGQSMHDVPQALLASAASADWVEVVSAEELDESEREQCMQCIATMLGRTPTVRWKIESGLLAGVELHVGDLVVRNSWQADLERLAEELGHE